MTDDDIIEMAHQAGVTHITEHGVASATLEWLQKFASLVAERERLAARQWQGLTDEEIEMACWARVDKDLNVTHLDMDLCRNGQQNEYTALAIAIWDAAKKDWQGLTDEDKAELDDKYGDDILAHLNAIEAKLKEKNNA